MKITEVINISADKLYEFFSCYTKKKSIESVYFWSFDSLDLTEDWYFIHIFLYTYIYFTAEISVFYFGSTGN